LDTSSFADTADLNKAEAFAKLQGLGGQTILKLTGMAIIQI
jgi:hypothetical protein